MGWGGDEREGRARLTFPSGPGHLMSRIHNTFSINFSIFIVIKLILISFHFNFF